MKKILIVDDNPKARKMLRRHLVKLDYEVVEAENGETALKKIQQYLPDVVLLDVMIRDMTGFEVCKQLRNIPQADLLYIIMLTTVTGSEHTIQGLDEGADDYITKPFDIGELLARIRVGFRTVKKKRHAIIDTLTRLYNRNFFDTYLTREIDRVRRYQRNVVLIMIDLDHFKKVNDTYGHLVGDAVLTDIGKILRFQCRQSDIPVRWGGEEFVVLLPETELSGGCILAERIRQAIEGHEFESVASMTASLGIAGLSPSGQELIKRADMALYEAKRRGRNRVFVSE